MSRAKRQKFPVSQLPQRYQYTVDELTIDCWLSSLETNPENQYGELYVNAEQLKLLDKLHSYYKQDDNATCDNFIIEFRNFRRAQGGTIADFLEIDAVFDLLAQKVVPKTNHITYPLRKRNRAIKIKDFCIKKIKMFFAFNLKKASYSENINFHSKAFSMLLVIASVVIIGMDLSYKNSNFISIILFIILLIDVTLLFISILFLLVFISLHIIKNWKGSEELARDRIKEARKEALEDRAIVRELYEIATQKNLKYVELRLKSLIEQRKDSTSLDDDFIRVLVLLIVVGFYVFTSGSAVQSLLGSFLESLKVDPLAGLIRPLSIFSGLLIILSPFLKLPSQKVIADHKKCMSLLEQAQAMSNHTELEDST